MKNRHPVWPRDQSFPGDLHKNEEEIRGANGVRPGATPPVAPRPADNECSREYFVPRPGAIDRGTPPPVPARSPPTPSSNGRVQFHQWRTGEFAREIRSTGSANRWSAPRYATD